MLREKLFLALFSTVVAVTSIPVALKAQEIHRKPIPRPIILNEENEITYKVVKNLNQKVIDEKIMKNIAQKRLENDNFLWKVSDDLEILIYSRKKIQSTKKNRKQ